MLPIVDQLYIVAASVGFLFVTAGFVIGQMDHDGGVDTGGHSTDTGGSGDFSDAGGGDAGGDFSGTGGGDAGGDFSGTGGSDGSDAGGDFSGTGGSDAGGDFSGTGGDAGGGAAGGSGDFSSTDSGQAMMRSTAAAIKSGGLMQGARTGSSPLLFILKLLSPTTIATFLFCFGAAGLVIKRALPISGDFSLVPAIICGYIGNRMLSNAMGWVTRKLHSSTNFREEDLVGTQAEVSVSIPPGRVGEITFLVGAVRHTGPARGCQDGATLRTSSRVIITDIRDGIYYVEPFDDESADGTSLPIATRSKQNPPA